MKPSKEQADRFIRLLQGQGWEVRADHIYSEKDYLHFPFPDGWNEELKDLREVLTRRRDRFRDSPTEAHLDKAMRELLVKVHNQALDAIARVEPDQDSIRHGE